MRHPPPQFMCVWVTFMQLKHYFYTRPPHLFYSRVMCAIETLHINFPLEVLIIVQSFKLCFPTVPNLQNYGFHLSWSV